MHPRPFIGGVRTATAGRRGGHPFGGGLAYIHHYALPDRNSRQKRLRLISRVCPGTGASGTGFHLQKITPWVHAQRRISVCSSGSTTTGGGYSNCGSALKRPN